MGMPRENSERKGELRIAEKRKRDEGNLEIAQRHLVHHIQERRCVMLWANLKYKVTPS